MESANSPPSMFLCLLLPVLGKDKTAGQIARNTFTHQAAPPLAPLPGPRYCASSLPKSLEGEENAWGTIRHALSFLHHQQPRLQFGAPVQYEARAVRRQCNMEHVLQQPDVSYAGPVQFSAPAGSYSAPAPVCGIHLSRACGDLRCTSAGSASGGVHRTSSCSDRSTCASGGAHRTSASCELRSSRSCLVRISCNLCSGANDDRHRG